VMPTMLIPYTPSLSKFVESPKLAFLFIYNDVFFFSLQRLAHWGMSFKTYQAWMKVNVWWFQCFVVYKSRAFAMYLQSLSLIHKQQARLYNVL
jgi:hypothetical protein